MQAAGIQKVNETLSQTEHIGLSNSYEWLDTWACNQRLLSITLRIIMRILSKNKQSAQLECNERHDGVAAISYWKLYKFYCWKNSKKLHYYHAELVLKNTDYKSRWDLSICCDRMVGATRPDMVVVNKNNLETKIIEIAVPGDFSVNDKEQQNNREVWGLGTKPNRMRKTKAGVVPIVIGALGATYRLSD